MPPFHGDRMRSYAQVIQDITVQVMKQWAIGTTFAVSSGDAVYFSTGHSQSGLRY